MMNDPDNEHIYTDEDRFHAEHDKSNFASEDCDSDKSLSNYVVERKVEKS